MCVCVWSQSNGVERERMSEEELDRIIEESWTERKKECD